MLGGGLTEWGLILVVAILVLGPVRVMEATKMLGSMLGKAKTAFAEVQEQVRAELPEQELQQLDEQVKALRKSNIRRKAIDWLAEEKQG